MNKCSIFTRILLTCAISFVACHANATTYFVRSQGNDLADGETAKTAFQTIIRAARALNHGDSIVIGPGTYRGTVLIAERFGNADTPLAIIGDESGKRTGDAAGPVVWETMTPGESALFIHRAQDVTISGLTIRGVGEGVVLEKVRRARLERCSFDNLAKGISISECEDVRIESCVLTREIMGVLVKNSSRTRLAHLTIASCSAAGILLSNSAIGEISNCLLVDCASGMVADVASAPTWNSDYNTFNGTMGSWGLAPLSRVAYEWFSTTGQERHSNYVLPAFVKPAQYDMHIDPTVTWGGGLPGMFIGKPLTPLVALDRDGKPFTIRNGRVGTGAYDYPEPVPAPGWQQIKITLPAEGVRQSAAILAKDGNLLRTLLTDAAGVRELWWDGRDDTGTSVAAGTYEVRTITHDLRIVDDGTLGDNGNPLGTYNCDNAQRVVTFPDGSFVISTIYDEAGVPMRYYSATGQPVSGSALAGPSPWAIVAEGVGKKLIIGVGRELQRIVPPGERSKMANGTDSYPILTDGEQLAKTIDGKNELAFGGVAVSGGNVLVTVPLAAGSVVRVIALATGAKVADWPAPNAGDIDVDADGNAWVICGNELCCFTPQGKIAKRFTPGFTPNYLAVGKTLIALIDTTGKKIDFLQMTNGTVTYSLAQVQPTGKWLPVSGRLFNQLRDCAFLPDGQLVVCEYGRIRAIDPKTATVTMTCLSNFLDALVPNPKNPEYAYCYGANIFKLDHVTGAWEQVRQAPNLVAPNLSLAQCMTTGTIDGKLYLMVNANDSYQPTEEELKAGTYIPRRQAFLDITDPLNPRYAGAFRNTHGFSYTDLRIDKDGNLCYPVAGQMKIAVHPFLGRDAEGYLRYTSLGVYGKTDVPLQYRGVAEKDAKPREMFHKGGLAIDQRTNDAYLLACTPLHNKMVPAWGASGTGVGKMSADGRPLWFTMSSGGNYSGLAVINDGKEAWVMAGKDTNGGAIDLYSSDGLRLSTGTCSWGADWLNGMVDIREGLQAYIRPDGKPGATVEDDNIGRFIRYRIDGANTLKRTISPLVWAGQETPAGVNPIPHEVAGNAMRNLMKIPRVTELPVNGDWAPWAAAGITPQIVSLPIVSWGRTFPPNLLQSFEAGTSIGAMAYDEKNLYVYFLTTDNTPHFHARSNGENMFEFDSIELWIEEEQFGIGFNSQMQPRLFKYRYHNKAGAEWAAMYQLPNQGIWGTTLASVTDHPLGQLLSAAVGTSLDGKPGYALMAKIPMEEIKLVGGISGRKGGEVLPMTGNPGEIIRIGIAFDGMSAWGRSQDFKVYWPSGLMFSDPTTNVPAILGE